VTGWSSIPLNVAEIETNGLDLEVNYARRLDGSNVPIVAQHA